MNIKIFKNRLISEFIVFILFGFIFCLFNWRLFAFGSPNQLFLYGDNLSALNNLYYIFTHFNFYNIFSTFIGVNGMMGSYPMSEPQNSIFYLPITVIFVIYKLFNLNAVDLYYLLLFSHTLHFVVGTFFIYKICNRIFNLNKFLSFLGGLVYLGIGWNASSLGANTLSYMVGILPLSLFVFFIYLKHPNKLHYLIFVFILSFFLYAGGIVNFFFYLWLNFLLIFLLTYTFKLEFISKVADKRDLAVKFLTIFILAPLWSLAIYSVQLFSSYIVAGDIIHSSSTYDYLGFFASHLYDLIGLILPKFGLLYFGSIANPQLVLPFAAGASSMYVGLIPLIVIVIGIFSVKDKPIYLFLFLLLVNIILAFGAMFFLYDITFFLPGNDFFRGQYKYLAFAGIYISVLVPLILKNLELNKFNKETYKKVMRYVIWAGIFLFLLAVSSGVVTLGFSVLQRHDYPRFNGYYNFALTLDNYFFRTVFMLFLSFVGINFFVNFRNKIKYLLFIFILLLDISINYKYAMYYQTKISDLVSTNLFKCCQNKTVLNNIDKYSQVYMIPEVINVDPIFNYTAIPNRYLTEYNNNILDQSGNPNTNLLMAAGIDGILTTRVLPHNSNYNLVSSKSITLENYKKLFLYNANGDIHNDWGSDPGVIGGKINYFKLKKNKRYYFTSNYMEMNNQKKIISYLKSKKENSYIPILFANNISNHLNILDNKIYNIDIISIKNSSTSKMFRVDNNTNGVLFINIPYSKIWKASINGKTAQIYRTNYAFMGIKIEGNKNNNLVDIYVDTKMLYFFLYVSIISFLTLLIVLIGEAYFSFKKIKLYL